MTGTAPFKLLLTADAVGGVWHYAVDLAGALRTYGVAPTIALLGPAPTAAQRAMLPAGVPLIETGLPLDWLADGPEPVQQAGREIARLAARFDLVQLNMPSLAAAPYAVPTVAVAHGCLSTWWEAAEGGPLPSGMAWQVELTRAGLRAADAVVAPTRAFARTVQRHYALSAEPVAVHNGRRPLATDATAAPHDHVFTAGRLWDRVKNTALLDEVAGRLSVPFFAAGPTAAPHGERVTLHHLHPLGLLDEQSLAARLSARPVFVSAARFEPFGLAVLEAAQAGCPLVLSDIASFRELWEGAALFVPADDAPGFVATITRVIGDEGLRRDLGQSAAAQARRYTPNAMTRTMAGLYARLLGQPRSAAA